MRKNVKIPYRVIRPISRCLNRSYKVGEIFNFIPKHPKHKHLLDRGYIQELNKDEYRLVCGSSAGLQFENASFEYGDEIDIDLSEDMLRIFLKSGSIKKIFIEGQDKPKYFNYTMLCKELDITWEEVKEVLAENKPKNHVSHVTPEDRDILEQYVLMKNLG